MPKITSRSEALLPDSANRVLHVNRLVSAAPTLPERAYLDPAAASSNPKHCGSARQPAAHEMCNRLTEWANTNGYGTPGGQSSRNIHPRLIFRFPAGYTQPPDCFADLALSLRKPRWIGEDAWHARSPADRGLRAGRRRGRRSRSPGRCLAAAVPGQG